MDEDEELLQDFIVEAGEILELLSEQLVDLENRPNDKELLNAVFRGFHTIKGGGSFLALNALVEVCHSAENVFDMLRNGERVVDEEVIDVILPVLDLLNTQFDAIRSKSELPFAEKSLMEQLNVLLNLAEPAVKQSEEKNISAATESAAVTTITTPDTTTPDSTEITDEEFDKLLDVLDGARSGSAEDTAEKKQESVSQQFSNSTDEITEDEFDKLLDSMSSARQTSTGVTTASKSPASPVAQKTSVAKGGDFSDNEFENLLDDISASKKTVSQSTSTSAVAVVDSNEETLSSVETRIPSSVKNQSPITHVDKAIAKTEKTTTVGKETSSKAVQSKRENTVQAESTVRVDTKRLDDIMNMVGELVLVRNRMATIGLSHPDEELAKVVANLDVVTSDLQTAVMKTRMQPIKKVFGRFPRVVRDLARSLKKEVQLDMVGEETDLDKNLVEALADPLVHLVRNAVDHGIETPDIRESSGKSRIGKIVLSAKQEGDHILLTIEDDGKGMSADTLRKAAVTKGMMDETAAARLDDKECYNLIFQPGFSTKTEISDVSGRGVGMDVVKTSITRLNGSVEIDSQVGRGSVIIIKVPLTLAIMPTLMIVLSEQIFALPLANVNEIFDLDSTKTNTVDGQLVIMVRDKALPLFYLRNWLVKNVAYQDLPTVGHVVVVTMGARKIGFVVDSLIGQEEVVIKPLGALLHGMKGLAGATITGDGRISLILDIPGLMQTYARSA